MIASTEHKLYKKLKKKGNGSILKAIRVDKGGGKGLMAAGIIFLVFALLFAVPAIFDGAYLEAFIWFLPCVSMIAIGMRMKNKRTKDWVEYYMSASRYTENELRQVERELASPAVRIITCKSPGATMENYVAAFVTENYVLVNGVYPYVKRLEDIIAIAYSDSTDNWKIAILTKQDEECMTLPLFTDADRKATLCEEIMQELHRANPAILCGQEIVCEGQGYILERDGAEILRLYREGRVLENAVHRNGKCVNI